MEQTQEKVLKMEIDRFWEIIEFAGWEGKEDYGFSKRRLMRKLPTLSDLKSFRLCFGQLESDLRKRIEDHEETTGGSLELGDDGFGDLVCHIIGLGRAVYESTMEYIGEAFERAEKQEFTESFGYAVPYETDYDESDKESHRKQRERDLVTKNFQDKIRVALTPLVEEGYRKLDWFMDDEEIESQLTSTMSYVLRGIIWNRRLK